MTICLAAIAKNGTEEYIVFGTDHMVSTQIGQFEHSITKYKFINENTVAMLAGNPLFLFVENNEKACFSIRDRFLQDLEKNLEIELFKLSEKQLREELKKLGLFGSGKRIK